MILAGSPSCQLRDPVSMCSCCNVIVYAAEGKLRCEINLSEVRLSAASCSVCAVLLVALRRCDADGNGKISLRRTSYALIADAKDQRLLRFCVDPGEPLFPLVVLVCGSKLIVCAYCRVRGKPQLHRPSWSPNLDRTCEPRTIYIAPRLASLV
jgi:hypothetical protein